MSDHTNKPANSRHGLSPKRIYDKMSKVVIGQHEAKKTIANALFLHFVKYCQSLETGEPMQKANALLMGPSGCGKTLIVREASKAIREITGLPIFPVLEIDCTELTGRGWEGDSLSDMIKDHYSEYGSNESTFNTSIVFLDEFDKLCKSAVSSSGHDANRNTQYNILKMMENSTLKMDKGPFNSRKISTEKMLFVLAGNFSEVRRHRELANKYIGFKSPENKALTYIDYHQELETAGMATQLVGRTVFVAELLQLSKKELDVILRTQLIPTYEKTYKFLGQELIIPEDVKGQMVTDCFHRKTGARGLQTDLGKYMEEELFDMEL